SAGGLLALLRTERIKGEEWYLIFSLRAEEESRAPRSKFILDYSTSPRILLMPPNAVRVPGPELPSASPIHDPAPAGLGRSLRRPSTYRGEIPRASRWPCRLVSACCGAANRRRWLWAS